MGGAKPLRQPTDVSGQVVRYWTQVKDSTVPSFTLFAHQDIGIQKSLDSQLNTAEIPGGSIPAHRWRLETFTCRTRTSKP
jgi:hypothetical protein